MMTVRSTATGPSLLKDSIMRALAKLLHDDQQWQALRVQASQHAETAQLVIAALPKHLQSSVTGAHIRLNALVIGTFSSASAARIRLETRQLRARFSEIGHNINEVRVKVQPATSTISKMPQRRQRPSADVVTALQQASQTITHPKIQSALQTLADHLVNGDYRI